MSIGYNNRSRLPCAATHSLCVRASLRDSGATQSQRIRTLPVSPLFVSCLNSSHNFSTYLFTYILALQQTYYPQVIPSPLRAWVITNATHSSMVLRRDRKFTKPGGDGSKILVTDEYMEMLCLARRMVDIRSHVFFSTKDRQIPRHS